MSLKVLGQTAPAATTNTNLYTVPATKSTVISTLTVCNRSSSPVTYRVAVRPGGATISNEHYLVYDTSLPSNSSDFMTIGMTLAESDIVTVYSSSNAMSFTVFGDES